MKQILRKWIGRYKNGDFNSSDFDIQIEAGWTDWTCHSRELPERLKKMAEIITNIRNEAILDNFTIRFKNNCPADHQLYDDFRLESIDGSKYMCVECDHPYGDDHKFVIRVEYDDIKNKFTCDNEEEVIRVIEELAFTSSKEEEVNMEDIKIGDTFVFNRRVYIKIKPIEGFFNTVPNVIYALDTVTYEVKVIATTESGCQKVNTILN